MLVTFYGVYRIPKNVKWKKCGKVCGKYLSNLRNLLHFFVTFCSICAFAMTIFKILQSKYKLRDYRKNPEQFVSFSLIAISENITIFRIYSIFRIDIILYKFVIFTYIKIQSAKSITVENNVTIRFTVSIIWCDICGNLYGILVTITLLVCR